MFLLMRCFGRGNIRWKATEFGTGEEEVYDGGDGGEVRWCERRRCRWCGRWMMAIGCEILFCFLFFSESGTECKVFNAAYKFDRIESVVLEVPDTLQVNYK